VRTKMIKTQLLLLTVAAALATGCTWVKPVEGSDQVELLTVKEVAACKKLGHTTSHVKNEVAGLTRNQETVSQELITLGKNQAVEMGGDTIVQSQPLRDGKVVFDIYKCNQ